MVSKAIEAAFLKQPALAKAAGISYHALRQYRKGQRTPSAAVIRRLAKALREQGARLGVRAELLGWAAGKPPKTSARRKPGARHVTPLVCAASLVDNL